MRFWWVLNSAKSDACPRPTASAPQGRGPAAAHSQTACDEPYSVYIACSTMLASQSP
jgi:hypothetical protein